MSLLSEAKELSFEHIAIGFALLLATIAPGSLILLHFKPDLLLHLESFKFLIVCCGLTFPLLFLNTFYVKYKDRDKKSLAHSVGVSTITTSSILYTSLAASYLWSFRFPYFLGAVGILEFTIILYTQSKYYEGEVAKNTDKSV